MTEPDVLREQLAAALCKRDRNLPRTWDYEEDYYRALADAVLPLVEQPTKLAEANGSQARFWADHFAEIDKANREALGAHHKPGHSVAELITALVQELAEAREFGNDAMNSASAKTREIREWAEGYGKLSADNKRLTRELASHPAIPADWEEGLRTGIKAWLDTEDLSKLSKEDIARGASGAAVGVLEGWAAPSVGSDTTAVPEGNAAAAASYQCTATHATYGKCFLPPNEDDHPWGHENFSGKWPVQPGDFPAADPQTTTP